MAICPKVAFNKLSKSINLSYYVGRGCAEAIRDACNAEPPAKDLGMNKPVSMDRVKPKPKPKAK
jgi:hypothetical protein